MRRGPRARERVESERTVGVLRGRAVRAVPSRVLDPCAGAADAAGVEVRRVNPAEEAWKRAVDASHVLTRVEARLVAAGALIELRQLQGLSAQEQQVLVWLELHEPVLPVWENVSGPGDAPTSPDLPDNLHGGAEVADRTCSIDGCERRVLARGLCSAHYQAEKNAGRLADHQRERLTGAPIADRLFQRRQITAGGCWEWTGSQSRGGYGGIRIDDKLHRVHRVAYEHFVGPIAEGLQIDHLCRNRLCFNPDHLEPVTQRVNIERGLLGAAKTHCSNGHEYTPENVAIRRGRRRCKVCDRERSRAYYLEHREEQNAKSTERKRRRRREAA